MTGWRRLFFGLLWLIAGTSGFVSQSQAGWITRARLEAIFRTPLVVGEKDDRLPIWPILKQEAGTYEVIAYVFESNDFAPIPGFGGSPPNLLIALGADGSFRDVRVLSQHEPVFVDGLGPGPLNNFVRQYVGLSARHTIRVGRPNARASGAPPETVVDGVAMATASTRVINEELLASALAVARRKLGFGATRNLGLRVVAKPGPFERLDWHQLLQRGLVREFVLTNSDVDKRFSGTAVAVQSAGPPNGVFARIYLAYLNVPSVGRNLLGDKLYEYVMASLAPGDHAVMVLAAGPWSPIGDDFVPGAIPDRIAVIQDSLSIPARDMAIDREGQGMAGIPSGTWTILKIAREAGLDPTKPWSLSLKVTREHGQVLAERVDREFAVDYSVPAVFFDVQQPDGGSAWSETWRARGVELAGLALMLSLLMPVLMFQNLLVPHQRAFKVFRLTYLALTLGFIGWVAQAQLSIVTIVGLVRAATLTHDLSFLLYDPPSLVLWAVVVLTAFIWGRGTFCGWLCPFGALQEILSVFAPKRQLRVPARLDAGLRRLKYVLLAAIILSAAVSTPLADRLVEVEPFKTSITLYFVRSFPFVTYTIGLLVLNMFVYKAFCRYMCPLGAALAVIGRLRLLRWIPRRDECGSPCQLCSVRCRYGAIGRDGEVSYNECFQCMDCVTIIKDDRQCVPQVLARRRSARTADVTRFHVHKDQDA